MSSEGLQRLGQLIDRTPDRVVANLMVFKAVENLIPFTNLKMLKLANNYLASVVGSSAMAPHHEICLEATKEKCDQLNIRHFTPSTYPLLHYI